MDNLLTSYFSGELKCALENITSDDVTEIRLRLNFPVTIICFEKIFYLMQNAGLSASVNSKCIIADEQCIKKTFESICRYSIHSYQNDICRGFVTIKGGHRVGICGTAVTHNGEITNIKDISSLNFRIARQVKNCSEELYNTAYSSGLNNILIAGVPSSGKTTLLRDLCRKVSRSHKVSVIDERGEIAGVYSGIPQNDVGINTDIFNGYSKAVGIETAVRVMSPEIIFCDEAGGSADMSAFEYALSSGVYLAVTIHAECLNDIIKKVPFYQSFDYIFFLDKYCVSNIVRKCDYDKIDLLNSDNYNNVINGKLFCN